MLFDIGGILAADVWESLFLDCEKGIATKFGLNKDTTLRTAHQLWEKYSHANQNSTLDWQKQEINYWQEVSKELKIPYNYDYYCQLTDEFIVPFPGMKLLLRELYESGVTIAICSNNTEFWF